MSSWITADSSRFRIEVHAGQGLAATSRYCSWSTSVLLRLELGMGHYCTCHYLLESQLLLGKPFRATLSSCMLAAHAADDGDRLARVLCCLQQYMEQIQADPHVCAINGTQPPAPKRQRTAPSPAAAAPAARPAVQQKPKPKPPSRLSEPGYAAPLPPAPPPPPVVTYGLPNRMAPHEGAQQASCQQQQQAAALHQRAVPVLINGCACAGLIKADHLLVAPLLRQTPHL
jgi:hypothetical protein